LPSKGTLRGRVLAEALAGGPSPDPATVAQRKLAATPAASGMGTVLEYQEYAGRKYFDSARLVRRGVPAKPGVSSASQPHESH
jgi:hypothetical protein